MPAGAEKPGDGIATGREAAHSGEAHRLDRQITQPEIFMSIFSIG
jgi:hypothetical protein